jgi:hypothetical protein
LTAGLWNMYMGSIRDLFSSISIRKSLMQKKIMSSSSILDKLG